MSITETASNPCYQGQPVMQPINVLHVTFNMGIGGTEQVIYQLISASSDLPIAHHVACIDSSIGPLGERLRAAGVPIVAMNRKKGFDARLAISIRHYIKQFNITIVHCHQYTPYVYGLLGALGSAARVIFTEHGRFYPEQISWKRRLLNPIFERFTFAVTAISKATADALARYENFSRDGIRVIYNGIADCAALLEDSSVNEKPHLPDNASPVLGTISRLDPIKNHSLLLRAFKRCLVHQPKALLLIVGDGELRNLLEQQAAELQLKHNVIFTGYQANPVPWLALMDIFILPSLSEGTAMTLLEAMSLSKPVIASDVGGNPEIVKQEITGLITPSDDESALAEAMRRLCDASELRRTMGTAGRLRFLESFTAGSMVGNYLDLYREALPTV